MPSGIEVPEKTGGDYYEAKDVPHGEVRSRWYFSKVTGAWPIYLRAYTQLSSLAEPMKGVYAQFPPGASSACGLKGKPSGFVQRQEFAAWATQCESVEPHLGLKGYSVHSPFQVQRGLPG